MCAVNNSHMGFGMRFFSVEEEIEMLEGAKATLETQLANVKNRLEKLKA